jgi:hypothetical protein
MTAGTVKTQSGGVVTSSENLFTTTTTQTEPGKTRWRHKRNHRGRGGGGPIWNGTLASNLPAGSQTRQPIQLNRSPTKSPNMQCARAICRSLLQWRASLHSSACSLPKSNAARTRRVPRAQDSENLSDVSYSQGTLPPQPMPPRSRRGQRSVQGIQGFCKNRKTCKGTGGSLP